MVAETTPMGEADITSDPLLANVPEHEGYKVLGGVELAEKLGQGGMGAVFRGRHVRLEIDVALKVMVPPPGISPEHADAFVKRFLREARTAARIQHPNLIRVTDVNTESGVYYLVMDFVEGESAAERLERKGPLPEAEAVEIVLGAAEGLAEAHRRGIVHRDVKPDNIMVDKEGRVKVADLGLAKAFEGDDDDDRSMLTQTQQAMGTPAYMAPEQFESARSVGPPADVWSLGVTLYQLLTGKAPWQDSSIFTLADKIRREPLPDARELKPELSGGVCEILDKALRKDAAERYADCGEMADALAAHLTSLRAPKDKSPARPLKQDPTVPPSETSGINERSPNDAEAYFNLGAAKADRGDYDGAIRDYEIAIELKPDFAEAYYCQGVAKADQADYDGAIRDLDKAIEFKPNDWGAYSLRGMAKYQIDDNDGAIRDYDRAIELKPNYAEAYYHRGLAKGWDGDHAGAVRDFDKAIELKPVAEAYFYRGCVKDDKGDYDGAIRDYDTAIELKPNYAEAYNNRGLAKVHMDVYDGAIRDYDKAIDLKPNDADAYYNRGLAKIGPGDWGGAIRDLDKAIEFKPDFAEAYCIRGSALYSKCDYDAAIRDYAKATELNPGLAEAYHLRGMAKFDKSDYDGAIRDYDNAIRLKPDDADAYYWRGVAKDGMGDNGGAVRDYETARKLGFPSGK